MFFIKKTQDDTGLYYSGCILEKGQIRAQFEHSSHWAMQIVVFKNRELAEYIIKEMQMKENCDGFTLSVVDKIEFE